MLDWVGELELLSALPGPMRNQVGAFVEGFWAFLPKLVAALVFLLVVRLVIGLVRRLIPRVARRTGMRKALAQVILMLATVGLWLFGALIALTIVFPTITPGRALTTLGIGGVAIGFAFKDILENFLAGILLLIREPFMVNDFIECEGIDGKVEEITIRDTYVRQTDGQLVVAPNAMFFTNPVTVRTARDLRRTTIIAGVAYKEDVDRARQVIYDAVREVDSVRDDVRDVEIFAKAFGASSIDFEVTWWTGSTPLDIRQSTDKVVAAVKRALDEAGIEIPFPYTTLTFDEPMRMIQERERPGAEAKAAE